MELCNLSTHQRPQSERLKTRLCPAGRLMVSMEGGEEEENRRLETAPTLYMIPSFQTGGVPLLKRVSRHGFITVSPLLHRLHADLTHKKELCRIA
jgi:hypothetical protein